MLFVQIKIEQILKMINTHTHDYKTALTESNISIDQIKQRARDTFELT